MIISDIHLVARYPKYNRVMRTIDSMNGLGWKNQKECELQLPYYIFKLPSMTYVIIKSLDHVGNYKYIGTK